MEIKVVRKQKLVDICNIDDIVSVIEIGSAYNNSSLAIALRNGSPNGVGVIFIPLDKFTYHIPKYVALPREQYGSVVIMKKEVVFDSTEERNNSDIAEIFMKATITKKVTW